MFKKLKYGFKKFYGQLDTLPEEQCQVLIGMKNQAISQQAQGEFLIYNIKDKEVSNTLYRIFRESMMPVNENDQELIGISENMQLYVFHNEVPRFLEDTTTIWLSPIEYKEWYHWQYNEDMFGPTWYRQIKYTKQLVVDRELTPETKYVLVIKPLYK